MIKGTVSLNDQGGSIELYPFKTKEGNIDFSHRINVYFRKGKVDFTTMRPKDISAEVSWSGIGAVLPMVAEQYAHAIWAASVLASFFESKHGMVEKKQFDLVQEVTDKEMKSYLQERRNDSDARMQGKKKQEQHV